jgi:biotin synthase
MNPGDLRHATTPDQLLPWLQETDPGRLALLFAVADNVRRESVGASVHLRALIEISNHCVRQCAYCGLRSANASLERYRMNEEEILAAARQAAVYGFGTVVLQAGEDLGITAAWMADLVRRIKTETPLAVTLSLGERSGSDIEAWRLAGADRYLLRFETSDRELFDRIHPGLNGGHSDRFAVLRHLKALGYEVGSGIMVGLAGQTFESVATDLLLFRALDLDMIGIGPFIPHPATPLGSGLARPALPSENQVPRDESMVYRVLALARILCPDANIPSTTALATINKVHGRELGLRRGANVVMPNLTPLPYRRLYEIYPAKACLDESGDACAACLPARIAALGRHVGHGPGGRRRVARLSSATRPRTEAATHALIESQWRLE